MTWSAECSPTAGFSGRSGDGWPSLWVIKVRRKPDVVTADGDLSEFAMRTNAKKICSVLFSVTLFALSGSARAEQEFDREKAAKAIADSEMFKDCHKGINNFDACNCTIYTGPWNLIASYWGSTAVHPQSDSLKGNPVGYWLYKEKGYLQFSPSSEILTLSEKGRTASKGWNHVAAPGREADSPQSAFQRWDVPLATKIFIAITS